MIPSRGLHALRSIVPRQTNQSRNFSIIRATSTRSQLRAITPASLRPSLNTRGDLSSSYFVRNASTTPTPPTPIPTSAPSPLPNIDTITLDDIDFSSSRIPTEEGIGYLKEVGLDYGWGPTSLVQWTLEHVHIWGGLPWWQAIVATAVLTRVITFPLFVRSARSATREAALQPVLAPLLEEQKAAQKRGDTAAQTAAMRQYWQARSTGGVSFSAMILPPVVQGVIGFCAWKLLRAMAELPVPGLKTGGASWLTDLTIPDGFLILPTSIAAATYMLFRFGGESGRSPQQMTATVQKVLLYGVPPLLFFVTMFQPGALCVWFTATTILGITQAVLMQNVRFRRLVGLPPMVLGRLPPNALPSNIGRSSAGSNSTQTSQEYTRPRYQAPSIRRAGDGQATSQVIDTTLAQPQAKAHGVFDSLKDQWEGAKAKSAKMREDKVKQLEKKKKDAAIQEALAQRRRR